MRGPPYGQIGLPEVSVNTQTSLGPSEIVMQRILVGQVFEVVALLLQGISQLQN